MQEASYADMGYERWLKVLGAGGQLHSHIKDLPKKERPMLNLLGVKSLLLVPIIVNGEWWGFIGFDQCSYEREWIEIEIDALKTAARLFTAAIARSKADQNMRHLATHDYLTDLPNRSLFEDRLHQAFARADRTQTKAVLVTMDLDKFKNVNDTYGHPVGDKVLVENGQRLQSTIRATDTPARIGGDEFAVILEGVKKRQDIHLVVDKILKAIALPMQIEGHNITVNTSIGVSIYPQDAQTMDDLIRTADLALYKAKERGAGYQMYTSMKSEQLRLKEISES